MSFEDPSLARHAATVGALTKMPADQTMAILALRHWQGSPAEQAALWNSFGPGVGAAELPRLLRQFEQLLSLIAVQGRRKLVCHGTQCTCVGADEAVFANFLATAAMGDREDAMLMAMLLVRADLAPMAVSLAQTVGLEFRRLAFRTARYPEHMPASATRH